MFDKQQSKLKRAIGTLAGTSGRRIARRNARKRVLGALRALRVIVDSHYPAIVNRTGAKPRLTHEARVKKMTKAGWHIVGDTSEVFIACARAGIKVKPLPGTLSVFIPRWAYFVWKDNRETSDQALFAANKNRMLREAAIAKAALLK